MAKRGARNGTKDDGGWGKLIRDVVVILLLVLGIHSCVAKPFGCSASCPSAATSSCSNIR